MKSTEQQLRFFGVEGFEIWNFHNNLENLIFLIRHKHWDLKIKQRYFFRIIVQAFFGPSIISEASFRPQFWWGLYEITQQKRVSELKRNS